MDAQAKAEAFVAGTALKCCVERTLLLVLGIVILCAASRSADAQCIWSDDKICIKYNGPVDQNFCGGTGVTGISVWEIKLVCKPGTPRAGQGWDIWCRTSDNKCNVNKSDACPNSGQLTQWTTDDHCTHGGSSSNWNPPPDFSSNATNKSTQSVAQSVPRQLTWNYTFDSPGQQARTWTQIGPSNWVELNQNGAHGFFSVIQPSATVDGNAGVVVENDTHSIDVFIPTVGANGNNPDWLRDMAPGGTQWALLGQFTSASVPPRQLTWNYTFDPPGQQGRTWTQVGPSNWVELNQNGAHGFFLVIQPSATVDGNAGVVVENDAHSIDVFIPAVGANGNNPDWLRDMVPGGTQWALLGQFTSTSIPPSNR